MANYKTKIRYFTIADYEEEQAWLEDQHKQGWKLKKITPPCFFTFEEVGPKEVVYQLDYKNEKVTGEYLQMFRDYGWEYSGSCMGWNYFWKAKSQVESSSELEIFSDSESKLDMVNHIFKTRMLPLVVVFCTILIPSLLKNLTSGNGISNSFFIITLMAFAEVKFLIKLSNKNDTYKMTERPKYDNINNRGSIDKIL